jgi:hypothetical protein
MTTVATGSDHTAATALEKAAKYLCTIRRGLCPHVVEQYPCPVDCNLDTLAWECWVHFFRKRAQDAQPDGNNV